MSRTRWGWFVPIAMVVAILVATDYGTIFDTSLGFALVFLLDRADSRKDLTQDHP